MTCPTCLNPLHVPLHRFTFSLCLSSKIDNLSGMASMKCHASPRYKYFFDSANVTTKEGQQVNVVPIKFSYISR